MPEGLDWDLWLGPAPERPYHPAYHPWTWRNWWDFGTGQLGDLGCHILDAAFWALKLQAPLTIEAFHPQPAHKEIAPASLTVVYQYGQRGDLPRLLLALLQVIPPQFSLDRRWSRPIALG